MLAESNRVRVGTGDEPEGKPGLDHANLLILSSLAVVLSPGQFGCGEARTLYIGAHDADGDIAPSDCGPPVSPPEHLAHDGFYTKYTQTAGIEIVASDKVDDPALVEACSIVTQVLSMRPDVAQAMAGNEARVAVMGEEEELTELPGFQQLGPDLDDERGLGATLDRPWTAAAEENLLCRAPDKHQGELILVHSLAHSMRRLGIVPLEDDFDGRLIALYEDALADAKWQGTFAETSFPQYWAEGVQSWFDVNLERDPPDGIHNAVNTRQELANYDPGLFNLLDEYFPSHQLVGWCW